MTRTTSLALTIIALSAFAPGLAAAASFDCAKAGTATEKLVCGDPTMSRLDEELAEAYRQALSADPEPDRVKARQKAWLRDRRDGCTVVGCLREVYRERIGRLHEVAAFATATGLSEIALADFLRAELKLESEYSQPLLVPVRSPTETIAKTIAFFVADRDHGGVKRGTIDVSRAQPRVLGVEQYYDECNCHSIGSASSVRLVASEPDFVVTEYSGGGGTCTGVLRMDILRVGESGALERVWTGETYAAGRGDDGVHSSEVAEISFPRMREGRDRAILRTSKWFRCGDENCFCQDGPLIREFVKLFLWDPATRKFRPAQ